MPGRLVHPAAALWEPIASLTALVGLIVGTAAAWAGGLSEAQVFSLAGFALGFWADIMLRGRAYAKVPCHQRKSRLSEWKDRLSYAVLGLGVGWLLARGVNGSLGWESWEPMINLTCVLLALLIIDFIRGLGRRLLGESNQKIAAGLVAGFITRWLEKKADRDAG